MALRTLAIRDAIVAELLKIGVTPSTGWESGAGAPQVLAGAPRREAISPTPERQLWVQHGGTEPQLEGFTAQGGLYRAEYYVWVLAPDPTAGEDMASKLERDVRRAIQNAQSTLEGSTLATGGIREGAYEVRPELAEAGIAGGLVHVYGDYIAAKGNP